MKLIRKVGSTSEIWQIFIRDSSSTTGAGLTGLTNASSGLTAYYHRDTDTTATAISLVSMTVGTFTSSGFKEIDATNMPGWYQFCPPNAALASGAKSCGFHLKGATNMAPLPIEVDLDAQVDVTFWNGTVVATPATAGIPDVNVKNINNVATTSVTTINANQGTTQPVNYTGTGASALVKSDVVDWGGAAVPALSGGLIPADMQAISTDTTAADNLEAAFDGTGSVMTLTQLRVAAANANGGIYVTNTTGPGADISSSNSGSAGVKVTGNGAGSGLDCAGGSSGNGILATGSGAGHGIRGLGGATSGSGFAGASSSGGHGMQLTGNGAGSGLLATGGSSGGAGISGTGGASGSGIIGTGSGSGHGIRGTGGSSGGNGILATSGGATGNGIRAVGNTTGHGISAQGGNTGGNAIDGSSVAGGGVGLNLTGDGTNPGMSIAGGSSATSDLILTHSLSPSLADIIWDAVMADHLDAGSTGEALNNKATVASIFAQVIENSYTFLEIMRLLGSSQGGKTNGAVAGSSGTFNIRDLADTKDRESISYDSDGNRLAVTRDLS